MIQSQPSLARRSVVARLAITMAALCLSKTAFAQAPLTPPQPSPTPIREPHYVGPGGPTTRSAPLPAIGTAPENTAAPSTPSTFDKPKLRHREGTQVVGRRGRIERRGDRFVFLGVEPSVQWMVLENLALERIMRVLEAEESDAVQWTVDGVVTEFRGVNYLLMRRAVARSAGERAAPRKLEPLPSDATTRLGPRSSAR